MQRLSPLLLFLFLPPAFAQPPQVTGVVNAASYAEPISPGSLASIFGSNLASGESPVPGPPFPADFAGTSVTINGLKAPLLFISPGQINVQVPSQLDPSLNSSVAASFGYYHYETLSVVVTTPSGSSSPAQASLFHVGPAMFTIDQSGCGQAAALNVAPDGSVSPNSPSNSAAPGDWVSLYGTGLGLASILQQPPDGSPAGAFALTGLGSIGFGAPALGNFPDMFAFPYSGKNQIPFQYGTYQYYGLAPGLVGVDQVNFQIPPEGPQGCAVPIFLGGPITSISIHTGRGQCVDPPVQSYGRISLTKTIASGTANDGTSDAFTAVFPSAPGLTPPPPSNALAGHGNIQDPIAPSRSCPVTGYSQLSAGPIQVQAGNAGPVITAQPTSQTGGVAYQQALPAGFITAGQYAISAAGGPVSFQTQISIPPPIQISTALPPGTHLYCDNPLKLQWTGGVPGTGVTARLVSGLGLVRPYDLLYADASAGSVTFPTQPVPGPGQLQCAYSGLPSSSDAQVVVEYSLAPESTPAITAQGITVKVQVSWIYRYVFGGLLID